MTERVPQVVDILSAEALAKSIRCDHSLVPQCLHGVTSHRIGRWLKSAGAKQTEPKITVYEEGKPRQIKRRVWILRNHEKWLNASPMVLLKEVLELKFENNKPRGKPEYKEIPTQF